MATATAAATSVPGFSADDFEILRRIGRPERFGTRRYLYHQDDPAQTVFLIESGLVKVARLTEDAREVVLDFLGAGDLLGAFDLIDRRVTDSFAQAIEPTEVRVIRRQDFEAAVTGRPALLLAVTRTVARRARSLGERLAAQSAHDAGRRLADLLDRLVSRFGVRTDHGLAIPRGLTHVDLANYIGSARETVTEALAEFARSRKVERQGRTIILKT
jgi:CRP-like cAMP-binding protein